jgi:hypothetical protein
MKFFYLVILLFVSYTDTFSQCSCQPFQNSSSDSIQVSNVSQLVSAVQQANSSGNLTILLLNGTYQLTTPLFISGNNVTIRSKNRNRDLVTVRGQGMGGGVGFVFNVSGTNFRAIDLTIGWVSLHAIQIHGELNSNNTVIQNVRFVDAYQQMLKVSYNPSDTAGSYSGIVECCLFEYTAGVGPNYYIGGIDAHNSKNWIVRFNIFKHIKSPSSELAEHAVHFWSGSANTVVDGNTIVNCDRGVGFGLSGSSHTGGFIKNNFIYTTRDVGIGLENTSNAKVYNNTVYTDNYSNSIEYRFNSSTGNHIANNLTNKSISSRDGGQAILQNNYTSAASNMFVNYSSGDLHLVSGFPQVVNQGITLAGAEKDFDCQVRPIGPAFDIGADEYGGSIGIIQISNSAPEGFFLRQNYPNPFNPATNIRFTMPEQGHAKLIVFDASGKEVTLLLNEQLLTGTYELTFDASKLASGLYFYAFASSGIFLSRKMLLVK